MILTILLSEIKFYYLDVPVYNMWRALPTFSTLKSSSAHGYNADNIVMHCSLEYQVQGGLLEVIKIYLPINSEKALFMGT